MRSTAYYWTHNQMIESQVGAIGARLGALVSGDKKDVVMTNWLATHIGRIAISTVGTAGRISPFNH